MTKYICPKCGSPVETFTQLMYPPIYVYKCTNSKCDYEAHIRDEVQKVVAPIEKKNKVYPPAINNN